MVSTVRGFDVPAGWRKPLAEHFLAPVVPEQRQHGTTDRPSMSASPSRDQGAFRSGATARAWASEGVLSTVRRMGEVGCEESLTLTATKRDARDALPIESAASCCGFRHPTSHIRAVQCEPRR